MFPLPDLPSGIRLARYADGTGPRFAAVSDDGTVLHPLEGGGHGAVPVKEARILPPVVPGKIVAVGLNYREHAKEMGKPLPEEPLLFMKATSALLAPGDAITLPSMSQRVEHEGEFALVVGRRATCVPVSEARGYLYGLTAANDVTARDLQKKDVQYTRAKSFDSFCPAGPYILVGAVPDDREIRTFVNGHVRQHGKAGDMIFDAVSLLSFISHVMTLEPGDLILTGTPSGVGPLVPGDVVEVAIEGVGTLKNPVVSRTGPDWKGFSGR